MSSEMIERLSATRFAAKNYNEFENKKIKKIAQKMRESTRIETMMRNENNNNSTSATLCLQWEKASTIKAHCNTIKQDITHEVK